MTFVSIRICKQAGARCACPLPDLSSFKFERTVTLPDWRLRLIWQGSEEFGSTKISRNSRGTGHK
jgi:hypothetical protein